jgi:putative transposase
MLAANIRRKRVQQLRTYPNWKWHIDEVFVKINGETHYLWRAVDHEGEVLEAVVTKKRDKRAALKLLRKLMRRYGKPDSIVTDKLKSYRVALRELGVSGHENQGRWINNRAENSHSLPGNDLLANHEKVPFRRRERAMQRFRRMRSLQKFASIHSSIYNHFNKERHQYSRNNFKENRTAALNEWRQLLAS